MYCKVLEQKFAFVLVAVIHLRKKLEGLECLKRRFGVGGCLITLDWRYKLRVLDWKNISNNLHLWNMFFHLLCSFIYFLIYLYPNFLYFHWERNLASFFVVLSSSLSLIAFLGNGFITTWIRLDHGKSSTFHFLTWLTFPSSSFS